jgi:molybdate transport system substrate-binding protein
MQPAMPMQDETTVHLLCAGAAKGLVQALAPAFEADTGARLAVEFGAVGTMKERLLAGAPCDLLVVTAPMVAELVAARRLDGGCAADLGIVRTGIAVPLGTRPPEVSTTEALREALARASALFFPDPERATAGIHFAKVLRSLGLHEVLAPRLRTYPQGAAAMQALADAGDAAALGCTQVSEILATRGVALAGPLPPAQGLATVYRGARTQASRQPALAEDLLRRLTGPGGAAARQAAGFEAG